LEYKVIERTKELEKSEKKFRQIFESIPDLFFLVDKNTVIIDFRGKREDFYAPPEEFLNKKMNEILPPNLRKMITEMVSKTIITKKPQIKEYSLLIKGQIRDYEGRFLFFSKEQVAIFIRDITERKLTEKDISFYLYFYNNSITLEKSLISLQNIDIILLKLLVDHYIIQRL